MAILRPPGPRGHLILGSLGELRRDVLGFLTRTARTYGDIASYRRGTRRIYLVSHPDLIEQVLVTDNRSYHKHYALAFLKLVLGNGLLTSEGDLWLRQRRLMQPAFSRDMLERYAPAMVAMTAQCVDQWRDGEQRDLHRDMTQLALAIVTKTLLDVDVRTDGRRVAAAVDVTMEDFRHRLEQTLQLGLRLPTRRYRRVQKAIAELHAIIEGIITQRRQGGADRNDLLSRLIHARDEDDGSVMTDHQLRDEVTTLFLAGHETTASALAWTFHLLAAHPQVSEKLHAELDAVLHGRLPVAADLSRLTYTESILKESMRLYPPAYAIGRTAIASTSLGGYEVRPGQTVLMSQWVVHRDERFFPDAEAFLPERWLEPTVAALPKYAYFPFGGGPRVCIGNTFAMLEATLVLATVAAQFDVRPVPGHIVAPYPTATLRPKYGILATVHRRRSAGNVLSRSVASLLESR